MCRSVVVLLAASVPDPIVIVTLSAPPWDSTPHVLVSDCYISTSLFLYPYPPRASSPQLPGLSSPAWVNKPSIPPCLGVPTCYPDRLLSVRFHIHPSFSYGTLGIRGQRKCLSSVVNPVAISRPDSLWRSAVNGSCPGPPPSCPASSPQLCGFSHGYLNVKVILVFFRSDRYPYDPHPPFSDREVRPLQLCLLIG